MRISFPHPLLVKSGHVESAGDLQHMRTAAFMVHNMYSYCCIYTYIMRRQIQYSPECMYGHQSMDQLGKVANPARGQRSRENK